MNFYTYRSYKTVPCSVVFECLAETLVDADKQLLAATGLKASAESRMDVTVTLAPCKCDAPIGERFCTYHPAPTVPSTGR